MIFGGFKMNKTQFVRLSKINLGRSDLSVVQISSSQKIRFLHLMLLDM